jgi:hypothetical protein
MTDPTKNCKMFDEYIQHFLQTATPEQIQAYERAREEVATWNWDEVVTVNDWIIESTGPETFNELYLGDFANGK